MISVLTGANSFNLQHELQRRVQAFVAEHGDMALERIDGEDADFARLQESLTSLPFLTNKKMVVLRQPSANKQFVEAVETLLADLPESTHVLIVEPKLDKRLAYYKYLKKQPNFQEFTELDQPGLAQWLVAAAKDQQGTLSHGDARYLVERVGSNQQLLSNELQKLLLYNSAITRQTIDLLTEPTPQTTIFQLLDAAFAGNSKHALNIYAEQRALKIEPQQIISMLAWQLHVLALIKTAAGRSVEQIAQQAKLNPFVVRKSQAIAGKLSLNELKKLVRHLLEIDTKSKRTALDLDEALQHYILTLAK